MKDFGLGKYGFDAAAVGACIAVLGVWGMGVVVPLLDRGEQAAVVCRHLEDVDRQIAVAKAQEHASENELTELEPALNARGEAGSLQSRINRRIAQIGDVAGTCGLDVQGCRSMPPTPSSGGWVEVPIHLEGQAGFVQAVQFLHRLQRECSGVGCVSLKLASDPNHPEASAKGLRFVFELRWLALPGQATPVTPRPAVMTASTGQ